MSLTIVSVWNSGGDAIGSISTTPGTVTKFKIQLNHNKGVYDYCLFFFDNSGEKVYPSYLKVGNAITYVVSDFQTLNVTFGGKCGDKIFDSNNQTNVWVDSDTSIDTSKTKIYVRVNRQVHKELGWFDTETGELKAGRKPQCVTEATTYIATRGTRGSRGVDANDISSNVSSSDNNYLSYVNEYINFILTKNIGTITIHHFSLDDTNFVRKINTSGDINWVLVFVNVALEEKGNDAIHIFKNTPQLVQKVFTKKVTIGNYVVYIFERGTTSTPNLVDELKTVSPHIFINMKATSVNRNNTEIFRVEIG